MMMKPMQTPVTRAEFERRFHLLGENMKQGKFHIAQGMTKTILGIKKVRYLPNGRIDFLSVDESARVNANMISQFSSGEFNDMVEDKGLEKDNPSGYTAE